MLVLFTTVRPSPFLNRTILSLHHQISVNKTLNLVLPVHGLRPLRLSVFHVIRS